MISFALRIFGLVLTVDLSEVEIEDDDEPAPVALPAVNALVELAHDIDEWAEDPYYPDEDRRIGFT